jgi:flagellar secretion chaperone FliS
MYAAFRAAGGAAAPAPTRTAQPASGAQYRETDVMSATPARLVVLLYEHLEVCLRRAQFAIQQQQIEVRVTQLAKSRAILSELLGTLDFERGGSIAVELSQLYTFLLRELVDVGSRQDVAQLAKIVDIVKTLGDGFREAASQVDAAPATAGA